MVWKAVDTDLERAGNITGTIGEEEDVGFIRLSPDDRFLMSDGRRFILGTSGDFDETPLTLILKWNRGGR